MARVLDEGAIAQVADAVEQLCCLEMRAPGSTFGVVRPLASAARQLQGAAPMLLAARALADRLHGGDAVIIATGFPVPGVMPQGETDGPPGAAALARALAQGLGVRPYLLGEAATLGPIRAACEALDLPEMCPGDWREGAVGFALDAFPEDELAEERAAELLAWLRPRALVITEKPGENRLGITHRAGGLPTGPGRARIEVLLRQARRGGVLTVGIGENGNEAGLGALTEATRRHKPFGEVCLCPCQGGIAAVDPAEITVVGSVSNWACYGIVACLALTLANPELVHEGRREERVIEACLAAGAVDGFGGEVPRVDGIPARVNGQVVDILRAIIRVALGRP